MSEASPTSSKSVTETVNGSHRLVIEGYSLAKGMGIGKHIASENFTVGGYQWAIYFYPDGKNPEDNSTYVSVFIALASEGTDVRALFELTLVDQSGKGKHKVHSHFDRSLESGPYALKYRGSMCVHPGLSPGPSTLTALFLGAHNQLPRGLLDSVKNWRQSEFGKDSVSLAWYKEFVPA
ncbi:hypothetical protein LguiA_012663 [Lonicera macranthoides]